MPTATEATATATSNEMEPALDSIFAQSQASIINQEHLWKCVLTKVFHVQDVHSVSKWDAASTKNSWERFLEKRLTTGTKILTSGPYKNELEEEKNRK